MGFQAFRHSGRLVLWDGSSALQNGRSFLLPCLVLRAAWPGGPGTAVGCRSHETECLCRCGAPRRASTGIPVGSSQLLMWGKKKKSVASSFNSCTMKITVTCTYTLGKFYCCLIYVIILFIPGLFNKTLYLLRRLILVCFFGYGTSWSVFM